MSEASVISENSHKKFLREDSRNIFVLAIVWCLFVNWFVILPNTPYALAGLLITPLVSIMFQQYFSGVIHESAHRVFYRGSKKWNDRLGNWFASYVFLYSIDSYRQQHFQHHGNSVYFVANDLETYPMASGKSRLLSGFLEDIFLITLVRMFFVRSVTTQKKYAQRKQKSIVSLAKIGVYNLLLWGFLGWYGSLAYSITYFVSYFTLYLACNRIRGWGTHADLLQSEGVLASTVSRNVFSPIWERIFFGNRMNMYHFDHHLNPSLSFRECERRALKRLSEPGGEAVNISAPSYLFCALKLLRS